MTLDEGGADCRRECPSSSSAGFADVRLSAVSSAARRDLTADESRARFTSECASRNFAVPHQHQHPVLESRDSRSRLSIRNTRHGLEEVHFVISGTTETWACSLGGTSARRAISDR
jgi:hypothetical protein